MMHKCTNGRSLLITDIESLNKELGASWVPYVVLLTAWNIEAVKTKGFSQLVNLLLMRGAKAFVCIGDYSEQLHDEVDEIIYEYDEERDMDAVTEILTTYHDDESIEDAVNYFVYGTELPKAENVGLLALVGVGDQKVEECLKKT